MRKKFGLLFCIIIIIVSLAIICVKILNNKIAPVVMDYSISEMKRIVSIIMNRSINSDLLETIDIDKLFVINKGSTDEILTVSLDSIIVNKINDNVSDACEDNLRLMEEGKYQELKDKFNIGEEYFLVPSGIIFNNTILNSIGPKIPINLKMIGNVTSNIKTDVKEYGINNSLLTISVNIEVELMVILPFTSDYIKISNDIPISIKLIQGKVPQFYGGSLMN